MKKNRLFPLVALLLTACLGLSQTPPRSPDITAGELLQHIKFLASDSLGGRKTGERGNQLAAQYIAKEFESYNLAPVGDQAGYFQSFDFLSSVKAGEQTHLDVSGPGGMLIRFKLEEDIRPLAFSEDSVITAPLVFAGYGISDTSLRYDDYEGIDVRGKIAVVLRFTPDGDDPKSDFYKQSALRNKVFVAREKGAAGIILVPGPLFADQPHLIQMALDRGPASSGIAAISMKWTALDSLLHLSGRDLRSVQRGINESKKPASFELPDLAATLQTQTIRIYGKTANIMGYLEGSDPQLKKEAVVVGAHMDHLGLGGEGSGSLKPDTVAIHHGADDNASGTAGVLELAQYLSSRRQTLKRSVLFIAFSGEELGLYGSGYYVDHPLVTLEQTVAMLNMDMVGRMKESTLVVEGMGSSPKWEEIAKKENQDGEFNLKLKPDGYGPSDHASFYMKKIPVMFFFTNLHEDYHRPSDTWEKINYDGEQKVVEYVARITTDIANEPEKPAFTVAQNSPEQTGGDRASVRVSLGVVPDYADESAGFKISGTRPGSPAEKAGLLGGDIIVKFGDKEIKNIYDFMYQLGRYKAGDEVAIVVKRGADEVPLTAKLEARRQ